MPTADAGLFDTVPRRDFLSLFREGAAEPNCAEVVNFLRFKKDDVSTATGVRSHSIRFDDRIPPDLRNRIREWAILLNLVAGHFDGNSDKTYMWFTMPNPLLGNMAPRDMIRLGRFRKLLRFVVDSLGGR